MSLHCAKYFCVGRVALLILGLTAPAIGQHNDQGNIAGTVHDRSALGEGCSYCHVSSISPTRETLVPLPALFTATFGVYDSPTMNSKAAEIGVSATGAELYSLLCLSCHDGSVASPVSGFISPAEVGSPFSEGLQNDHPVNMAYDPSADTGLAPVASVVAAGVPLFYQDGIPTVQCSSCHDPHNKSRSPKLLRVANNGSGLCLTCHR